MPLSRFARPCVAALLSAQALLAGCGDHVPPTFKIGVSQPLSGPAAARGQDVLNGMRLAAKELNAAGFKVAGDPVKIEIVPVDDKADPATGKKVAQDLVDAKVAAVVGDLSSDVTQAAIPVYKAGDVPQLFTSTSPGLVAASGGNAFRLVANDSLQSQAIAGYLSESLNAKKVALVYEDTAFGSPIAHDVTAGVETRGKALVLSQATDGQSTDFGALVATLKASPPDVLVAVLREPQLLALFAQMQAAQLTAIPVITAGAAKTTKLLNSPDGMKSVYVTSSIVDPGDTPAGKDFLEKFRSAYGADPVWAAHYGYDAVYILADVVTHARSFDAKPMRETLRTLDANAPVNGTMRFAESGEQRFPAITIYQRTGGKWMALMRSDKW